MHHMDPVSDNTTVPHDSILLPMNITAAEQHVRHYDEVLKLKVGFTSTPFQHFSAVNQGDAYNYGLCVLTTTIIYLYHLDTGDFLWHTFNYPTAALHIRNIIIAILHTG